MNDDPTGSSRVMLSNLLSGDEYVWSDYDHGRGREAMMPRDAVPRADAM